MIKETIQNYNNAFLTEKEQNVFLNKVLNNTVVETRLPEILFITSYPPRECGIATYSQDLVMAMDKKFNRSFKISICPIESENDQHTYAEGIKYILNKDFPKAFITLAKFINNDDNIRVVMIQHEFGLFADSEESFNHFLQALTKPVVIVFHTVLPHPDKALKEKVQLIENA